jgi:hypothetical protein
LCREAQGTEDGFTVLGGRQERMVLVTFAKTKVTRPQGESSALVHPQRPKPLSPSFCWSDEEEK